MTTTTMDWSEMEALALADACLRAALRCAESARVERRWREALGWGWAERAAEFDSLAEQNLRTREQFLARVQEASQ